MYMSWKLVGHHGKATLTMAWLYIILVLISDFKHIGGALPMVT